MTHGFLDPFAFPDMAPWQRRCGPRELGTISVKLASQSRNTAFLGGNFGPRKKKFSSPSFPALPADTPRPWLRLSLLVCPFHFPLTNVPWHKCAFWPGTKHFFSRPIIGHSWGLVYGEGGAPGTVPLTHPKVTSHVLHQDVPRGWYQVRFFWIIFEHSGAWRAEGVLPFCMPLQNPEVTSRKACLRNVNFQTEVYFVDVRAGCPCQNACFLFQNLEGLTEVFGQMSAGMSGPKLPLWADFSFLIERVPYRRSKPHSNRQQSRHFWASSLVSGPDGSRHSSDQLGNREWGSRRGFSTIDGAGTTPTPTKWGNSDQNSDHGEFEPPEFKSTVNL